MALGMKIHNGTDADSGLVHNRATLLVLIEWFLFTAMSLSLYRPALSEKWSLIASPTAEFFAFSWVYGLRLHASEAVPFQPHSQLLYPIFDFLNRTLKLSVGSPEEIFHNWNLVAYVYTAVLIAASTLLITWYTRRESTTTRIVCLLLYFVLGPYYLSDIALFSMSYHSAAIPLALSSLFIWRMYPIGLENRGGQTRRRITLLIYTAACVLTKPTFVAFAIPLWALEVILPTGSSADNRVEHNFILKSVIFRLAPIFAYGIATVFAYILYLGAYTGSVAGIEAHLKDLLYFASSQANMYDNEKLATPVQWFMSYVLVKMEYITLIPFLIMLLFLILTRKFRVFFAIISGLLAALFFLYSRSYIHAHPEFIAYLLVVSVVQIKQIFREAVVVSAIQRFGKPMFAWIIAALIAYSLLPLSGRHTDYSRQKTIDDQKVRKVVFDDRIIGVRTLALSKYPQVLYGAVDAICRGGSNIFFEFRSAAIDAIFADGKGGGFTCFGLGVYPGFIADNTLRIVFRIERDEGLESALERHRQNYPVLSKYRIRCIETKYVLTDGARLAECLAQL